MRDHGAGGLTRNDWLDGAAVLILRAGLVWFMFLWAAHKIITPKQYQGLVKHFDGVAVSLDQVYLIGGVQIAICVLALIGVNGGALVENSPGGVSQAMGAVMGLPLWGVIGVIGVVLTLIFRPMD